MQGISRGKSIEIKSSCEDAYREKHFARRHKDLYSRDETNCIILPDHPLTVFLCFFIQFRAFIKDNLESIQEGYRMNPKVLLCH